jgi:aspartate/methionine/tyrosine aminotransferase
MAIREFALERYFARWEFSVPHLLSASDCEALTVRELLDIAGVGTSVLEELRLGYIESQGTAALRERIAALYPGLSSEDVVVTSAPEEAIYLTMTTLLEPGDRVVVQVPCYQSLAELATHRGCEVVRWPLVETDTGWRIDLDHLADLLERPTRLIVVNAPHNPTGYLPTRDEHAALIALAEARGCWLFSDEMYQGLERFPASRLAPAAVRSERAVSLWGMSKSFALPGLRIGWLALRDRRLRDAIIAYKDYTTICSSAPGELLATIALDHQDAILARNRALIESNLALVQDFAARRPDLLAWRDGQAGSVRFVRLRGGGAQVFAERSARGCGVMVVPATMFDAGDEHLRLGLGRRGFPAALDALERFLRPA